MRPAQVLFVAPATAPETQYLIDSLQDVANAELVATPADALRRMTESYTGIHMNCDGNRRPGVFDALVLYEPRPGFFDGEPTSTAATTTGTATHRVHSPHRAHMPSLLVPTESVLEILYEIAPLMPRITVCGAWCDGELRRGRIRRGEIRLESGEAIAALRTELPRIVAGTSLWLVPMTTSDEEFLQTTIPAVDESDKTKTRTAPASSVRIGGAERELTALLESVAHGLGMSATPWQEDEFPGDRSSGDGIFDAEGHRLILIGDADDPEFLGAFERRLARYGDRTPCPTLLLIAFPRFDEIRRWERCGVAVLPKPFRIADIAGFLRATADD